MSVRKLAPSVLATMDYALLGRVIVTPLMDATSVAIAERMGLVARTLTRMTGPASAIENVMDTGCYVPTTAG